METELKLLLDGTAEFEAVLRACGPVLRVLQQRSSYFDDRAGRWRAAGWSVRLREQRDGAALAHVLTVKGPAPQQPGSSFIRRVELERLLEPSAAERALRGGDVLAALVEGLLAVHPNPPLPPPLDARQLLLLGVLANVRQVVALAGGTTELHLELDTTSYPDGTTGWEAELELPSEASAAEQDAAVTLLRGILQRVGVPWRPSTVTKLARFHASLRGRQ